MTTKSPKNGFRQIAYYRIATSAITITRYLAENKTATDHVIR